MLGSVVVVNTKLPETWIMLINNATQKSLISSTDFSLKVREKEYFVHSEVSDTVFILTINTVLIIPTQCEDYLLHLRFEQRKTDFRQETLEFSCST